VLVHSLLKCITLNKNLFYVYHIKFIEVSHCVAVLLGADGTGYHVMNNSFSLSLAVLLAADIPYLHAAVNIVPIRDFIYHLTDTFFGSCPAHPNPLISSIGNYTLADLRRQYTKYIHKRPKHILL
jgi:hypothetical protein